MHNQQQRGRLGLASSNQSFVIQICGNTNTNSVVNNNNQHSLIHLLPQQNNISSSSPSIKFNFSAMKLFHRFRKILMRFVFSSVPSGRGQSTAETRHHRSSERFEPPKTSCSSYYSSYSHYNEAIADCIEFFNKSAQDGNMDGRKSDVTNVV
ncbi:hypothetical protein HN51_015600 [Arachis hypogaea]|uniref:Uncharacterized protein n=1 Tax=Arachis hypogaea TaxID=3818 RepID=A0A445CJU1_ARAHY|nr:uncharacterized protein LOC112698131 [Arachis hypogaea]QHO46094.1 uncharacterized protein DS421_6g184380 [Arachis hypogaea]RYR51191.1 hypothetical protein Ahy_A06g026230 isoform A [Arachis hypogaea]